MDPNYSGLIARPYNGTGPAIERAQADKRNTQYPVGALTPILLKLDNAQALTEYRFAGDSIYLDRRSTGQIRFRLDMAWPVAFPLGANDGLRNLPFKQLLLEWDAQPGLVAYLWTGYGVDLSLALGSISTIGSITNPVGITQTSIDAMQFGDDWTATGESFAAGGFNNGVSAQINFGQIFNPVGSGKIGYIDRLRISAAASDRFFVFLHNVALGVMQNTWRNKNGGGAAGAMQYRQGNSTGTGATLQLRQLYILTNTDVDTPLNPPVRLPEGWGLHVETLTFNTALITGFDGREKAT